MTGIMAGLDAATTARLATTSQSASVLGMTRWGRTATTGKATIKIIQHLLDNGLTIDDIHLIIFSESPALLPPLLSEEMNAFIRGKPTVWSRQK